MSEIKKLLLLPHINIQNANALSSPLTIGFPAITAWLGAVHALQRKLNALGYEDLKFIATGIVSHRCDIQTYKNEGDYVHSIIGTANPLDKSGARSAFIEEARCHLDVSLLIEYNGITKDDENELIEKIKHILHAKMKLAGGDILSFKPPAFFKVETGNGKDMHTLRRKLMPGYALIERRDLMVAAMENGQDAIDGLLEYLCIHHTCEYDDKDKVIWSSARKAKGWIVPIAIGFHGISALGTAKNQRDPDTPHRFAESVVTLGEYKMPHRIESINEIMWHYKTTEQDNLYLCTQSKSQPELDELFDLFN